MELELASRCIGPWRRVEEGSIRSHWSWPQATVTLHKGSVVRGTGSYEPRFEPKSYQCKLLTISVLTRMEGASQLATNRHIQAINAGLQKYTQIYILKKRGWRKMRKNHMINFVCLLLWEKCYFPLTPTVDTRHQNRKFVILLFGVFKWITVCSTVQYIHEINQANF